MTPEEVLEYVEAYRTHPSESTHTDMMAALCQYKAHQSNTEGLTFIEAVAKSEDGDKLLKGNSVSGTPWFENKKGCIIATLDYEILNSEGSAAIEMHKEHFITKDWIVVKPRKETRSIKEIFYAIFDEYGEWTPQSIQEAMKEAEKNRDLLYNHVFDCKDYVEVQVALKKIKEKLYA